MATHPAPPRYADRMAGMGSLPRLPAPTVTALPPKIMPEVTKREDVYDCIGPMPRVLKGNERSGRGMSAFCDPRSLAGHGAAGLPLALRWPIDYSKSKGLSPSLYWENSESRFAFSK